MATSSTTTSGLQFAASMHQGAPSPTTPTNVKDPRFKQSLHIPPPKLVVVCIKIAGPGWSFSFPSTKHCQTVGVAAKAGSPMVSFYQVLVLLTQRVC